MAEFTNLFSFSTCWFSTLAGFRHWKITDQQDEDMEVFAVLVDALSVSFVRQGRSELNRDVTAHCGSDVGMSESLVRRQRNPTQQSKEPDESQQVNDGLLQHGSHGQRAAAKAIYERGIAEGKTTRQIPSELGELKRSYERLISSAEF